MPSIPVLNLEEDLATQVAAVAATGAEVQIIGGGSKRFYGEPMEALPIDVSAHSGVIDYDPAELVITLRAGCKLSQVETLLAENRQMFGFEPPCLGADATIGGMVASGLAGPRRAYAGSIRDFVLGAKMLDGRGKVLQFGGRVIKNVAGFDVSRLLVGSHGTLGIILEVSIRVIPMYETEKTLAFEHASADRHVAWINELGALPYPISASTWVDGCSLLRLSGSAQGVDYAVVQLGGETVDSRWQAFREQTHEFFDPDQPLTRISVPPASAGIAIDNPQMIEWGGAQRWFSGELDIAGLRQQVPGQGIGVCAYRGHTAEVPVFHPLPDATLKLQRSIKSSFDPAGIYNPGRICPGL
ncbi:MAG: glycolate oxidase subunit GlcE [Gammaproteobacteria bacterium]|nr:glycolate oxidase subunit GlcE [Gammaproteobacteria bacterium]MCP4981396.1 glycolate oxidase subunit GlcE [Gammaproteobacteria bacterium]